MLLLEILFWTVFLLIAHSYIFYPFFIQLIGRKLKNNLLVYTSEEDLPRVSILMAAHNEEAVIQEKIESILNDSCLIKSSYFRICHRRSLRR